MILREDLYDGMKEETRGTPTLVGRARADWAREIIPQWDKDRWGNADEVASTLFISLAPYRIPTVPVNRGAKHVEANDDESIRWWQYYNALL